VLNDKLVVMSENLKASLLKDGSPKKKFKVLTPIFDLERFKTDNYSHWIRGSIDAAIDEPFILLSGN
jgi:hypothetical protein